MEKYSLAILATSDIHGQIMPIHYADNSKANIGLAKLSTLINRIRQDHDTILIDNGDILQGSPIAYYHAQIKRMKSNPISDVLNLMGYDACIVGNHDFNYGLDYLTNYKNSLACPLLSANIVSSDGNPFFLPYIIKEVDNGIRIAIIGVTTNYIPNWERYDYIKDLQFLDAFDKTKELVSQIKKQEHVHCIIVSYHGGFERDLKTSEPTEDLTGENQGHQLLQIDGIDVLITGHQHRSIQDQRFNKAITQTASYGKELAMIQLEFHKIDNQWLISHKQTSLLTTEQVEADQRVIDQIKEVEQETQRWLDQPLGYVKNGDLIIRDPFEARVTKHPLVTLINQVQMDVSGAEISITSLGNEIHGLNHEITMRNIISTYVFQNTLVVLEVTGQDIKDALEKSANYFAVEDNELKVNKKYLLPKPQHYNYDLYDGIEYEIHVREPLGNKIKNIKFKGKTLDPHQAYHVIMNNYRASGGGNFYMFKNKKRIKEITTDMVELLANYIKKQKMIDIDQQDTIKIIY